MKVGVDGFSLGRKDSGIEIYTRELIKGLLARNYPVELYTHTSIPFPPYPRLTVKSSGLPTGTSTIRKLKWELSDISRLVSKDTTLFHSPHFILPFLVSASCKKVITIHDLAFLACPQFFDWKTKLYYRLFLKRSLIEADAIICISESCLNDVATYFPFAKEKLVKVHHGFKDFSEIPEDKSVMSDTGIQEGFILMIGTLNPRKNIVNAVRAFNSLPKTANMDLVIVGNLKEQLSAWGLDNPRIRFTGFISDQKLSALYRKASVLLFPSFYEGFGFPILEAMSVGLPVVTSNNSSIPEVSGYKREWLCDPADPQNILNLLKLFLTDANRVEVIDHGYRNIERFSWERMIDETIRVYNEV